jgi:DNA-binding response OmpR family regulator
MQKLKRKGVIIMTARGKTEQRIAGMAAGADAYLVKPVALEELVLHIRKLHERLISAAPSKQVWQLHRKRWLLTGPDGREVSLSQSETRLLAALGQASGNAVSKADLIRDLGFDPLAYDDRRLEGLVRRIRTKSLDEMGQALPLQTAYGFGYAFTETLDILN